MKEILIITSYFPPETGAASNRIFHLAEGLIKKGFKVSVITPLPNYPTGKIFKSYRGRIKVSAYENDIHVHRLWLYASNSKNKIFRLWGMLSYSLSLIWFFLWNKIPKTVIVQSPPLLVAFTSILCLRSKNRKLILNVSDLWPLAGLELGAFKRNFGYSLLERIEFFNYNNADLILGQSEEILSHVASMCPNKETFLYRNYPDFAIPNLTTKANSYTVSLKVVYAGLLGVAQGVLKLCQSLNYDGCELHIYGSGAEKESIVQFISLNPGLPIHYHGEVGREDLHKALHQYDLTIIPLLNRIYGSVPSKIFEYARLGLPILYFGGGEGESIITTYQLGWIAKAADYEDLNRVVSSIDVRDLKIENRISIQETAVANFDFSNQLKQLIIHL